MLLKRSYKGDRLLVESGKWSETIRKWLEMVVKCHKTECETLQN